MAYSVVRTDNMDGTKLPSALTHVKYYDSNGDLKEIENGRVLKLNGLLAGEREVYKGVAPSANTALKDVVLVAEPEVLTDGIKKNLSEYINEEGRIVRGYRLITGNTFSVTLDAFTGTPSVETNNVIELQAGIKLKAVSSATSTSTKVGDVIAIETVGGLTYAVVKIV